MKTAIRKSKGGKRPGAGRPATGTDPVTAIRFPAQLRGAVVKWAEKQSDLPTLSEAVRRLVEMALMPMRLNRSSKGQKARAKEMAAGAIDKMSDGGASEEDKLTRKRRLLKGPEEFREARVDRKTK